MQHGFATRNGLLAANLARADYTGIERVLELSYGGFLVPLMLVPNRRPPLRKSLYLITWEQSGK